MQLDLAKTSGEQISWQTTSRSHSGRELRRGRRQERKHMTPSDCEEESTNQDQGEEQEWWRKKERKREMEKKKQMEMDRLRESEM